MTRTPIPELTVVVVARQFESEGRTFRRGETGTVVHVTRDGDHYLVEFDNPPCVVDVDREDMRPLDPDLGPIRTHEEYCRAVARIEPYFENEPEVGSPEGERFTALACLLSVWEDAHFRIEPAAVDDPPPYNAPTDRVLAGVAGQFDRALRPLAAHEGTRDEETVPIGIVRRLINGENPFRVWRQHRGLTQAELADRAGVSRAFVAKLETRRTGISAERLKKIADVLGVEPDELLPMPRDGGRE